MKFRVFLGLVCTASAAFAQQEVEVGSRRLRVVLDPHLSPALVESEWESENPRTEPPAALELVGREGQVLDRLVLAAPLAKIDPEPLRGAPHPTCLVSADLTREAGSYNGPLTLPVQIVEDHLVATVAQSSNRRTEPIHLAQTLKAAWQRVSGGRVEDLLQVSCQPGSGGFMIFYWRYFLRHGEWKVRLRVQKGFWESEGNFPERSLFP